MIIDVVGPPMSGHLHPDLAVARALRSEHEVTVLTTPAVADQVRAAGLSFASLLDGADDRIDAIVNPPRPVGNNPIGLTRQFAAALDLQLEFMDSLLARWRQRRPDLVLADFTLPAVGAAADRLGLTWWTLHSSACVIEGAAGPPPYFGGLAPGRGPWGRARDAAGRALTRGFKHGVTVLQHRRLAELGATRAYRADGTETAYSPTRILAIGPRGLDFDRRVPAHVVEVGAALYTPPSTAPAPPFRPGRRQLLVTAGTQLPWYKQRLAEAAAAIAGAHPDLEVHVSLGGAGEVSGLGSGPRPENLTVLGYVDYARHLSGYDLVAHHGGSGVLSHTLAAGLPAVVTPIDYDQPDHAARLAAAGVALRAPLRGLPDAVARALADRSLARTAARWAESIAAYPLEPAVRALVAAAPGV